MLDFTDVNSASAAAPPIKEPFLATVILFVSKVSCVI
jgi:hypothetical protein